MMKKAWDDLKSFVTIIFTITLVALVLITAIKENWDIFQIVFTLFSSTASAIFTYYFTKKNNSNVNEENSTKIDESIENKGI